MILDQYQDITGRIFKGLTMIMDLLGKSKEDPKTEYFSVYRKDHWMEWIEPQKNNDQCWYEVLPVVAYHLEVDKVN